MNAGAAGNDSGGGSGQRVGGETWRRVAEGGDVFMRDRTRGPFPCFASGDSRRARRDCRLVIRSRGRWGKCG